MGDVGPGWPVSNEDGKRKDQSSSSYTDSLFFFLFSYFAIGGLVLRSRQGDWYEWLKLQKSKGGVLADLRRQEQSKC